MKSSSSESAILLDNLVRAFRHGGREKRAVDALSLKVRAGEMVGLLGPNGAGKTSTVKMLMTVLLPTAGSAQVLGHDVVTEAQAVRQLTGVILGGDAGLYPRLSAQDNLRLFADLYGLSYRHQRRRVPQLLEAVGLAGSERKRVETFSRGMKQRLHIARGLLHDPQVVILDEPSNGIDPVGARELRALIRDLVRQGRTVLLTTHYMFEADELCDRVVVMRDGKKIAEGTPESLKSRASTQAVLSVHVDAATDAALQAIRELPGVDSLSIADVNGEQCIDVYSGNSHDVTSSVVSALQGASILRVSKREPTLEDAYISLISGAEVGQSHASK